MSYASINGCSIQTRCRDPDIGINENERLVALVSEDCIWVE
jgi:hypothetical protein